MKDSRRRARKVTFRSRYGHSGGDHLGAEEDHVVLASTGENSTSEIPQECKIIWSINNGGPLTSIRDSGNSSFDSEEGMPRPIIHSSVTRARLQMAVICQFLRKRLQPPSDSFNSATESHSAGANLLVVAAQIRSMAHFVVWYAFTNWRISFVHRQYIEGCKPKVLQ